MSKPRVFQHRAARRTLLRAAAGSALLAAAATCRQQGRPLLAFLVAAGEAALQGTAAPSLLPAPQGD